MRYAFLASFLASCSAGPPPAAVTSDLDYDRRDWRHWTDADGDCQDARQEVLIRQSEVPVSFEDGRECRVASGRWTCPYTGEVLTDPSALDVDHVVSLREAHDTGGAGWDAARREAFANDLDSPELAAVTASSNRSKGSRGPEEWMPPDPSGRCRYLRARVTVQLRWGLAIPEPEARHALRLLVEECSQ